jgi:hypothetical protein
MLLENLAMDEHHMFIQCMLNLAYSKLSTAGKAFKLKKAKELVEMAPRLYKAAQRSK